MTAPTLFVSHGAPTWALEPGAIGATLAQWAQTQSRPNAVLVVSPHWMTRGIAITGGEALATIHDFYGFPAPLYQLRYPARGDQALSARVKALLATEGIQLATDEKRGLDHGAWVPLMHLFPEAEVPVTQLSLPADLSPAQLVSLGAALAPLRQEGVLILASGGITHNLGDMQWPGSPPAPYAVAFMDWFADHIAAGDLAALTDYRRQAPHAQRAHPTDEHLRPIFVAIGAAGDDWHRAERIRGGIDFGVIGMDAYAFPGQP